MLQIKQIYLPLPNKKEIFIDYLKLETLPKEIFKKRRMDLVYNIIFLFSLFCKNEQLASFIRLYDLKISSKLKRIIFTSFRKRYVEEIEDKDLNNSISAKCFGLLDHFLENADRDNEFLERWIKVSARLIYHMLSQEERSEISIYFSGHLKLIQIMEESCFLSQTLKNN